MAITNIQPQLHFFPDWLGRKEGNVLFNDALNTFYLGLYGVTHMVKDHSDSERGNPLPPHRLLFPISSKGSFICIIPDRIINTTAFVTPVMEHWLEREIAQWVHREGSICQPTTPWANALTTELYLTLDWLGMAIILAQFESSWICFVGISER